MLFGGNLSGFPHQIPPPPPAPEAVNPFFDPCPFRDGLPAEYLYS